jgi:excisionase family DNA binding protein
MKRLLDVREAAAALRVSEGTMRGLLARRRIRHERHGLGRGVIRIPEDAIEEYREAATVAAGREGTKPAPRPPAPRPRNFSLDD